MIKKFHYFLPLGLLTLAGAAWADKPITTWLFDPATPIAREVLSNFWITMGLLTPFLLLPQVLLLYAIWKFKESRGHQPATFHENLKLEIVWTIVPVITLILLAIPMYKTLRKMDVPPKSDLVVEVIGHQFFWEYRYPKFNLGIANEPLVVPADKVVTLNCTSVDVIHSWWVPAFGVKQDANPGRITHTWFKADAGTYKGQCAELCGPLHGEMLINVKVLPEAEFEAWAQSKAVQALDTTAPQAAPPASSVAPAVIGQNTQSQLSQKGAHEQRIDS
ncbi:cytochrome c oxidase subunit II [candidate division KSB1 bacterium]|nr:cytochrome c oxidase subunit II [candidate division KSB1 bacterium]